MNILFISPAIRMDYQCDALFIGLRQLYGPSVVDYPRINHLYDDYGDVSDLYGHGFTMTKILPGVPVNRSNIESRIATQAFDLIVYGSVQRDMTYLGLVTATYPRGQVLFIDGEDQSQMLYGLEDKGIYFKRELYAPYPGVHPIHFAIPASKIGTIRPMLKDRVRAFIDPRDRTTYIYKDEHSYYEGYSRSLFSITMRKGGFDTMRTLEIMANGSIPLYLDLHECPATTCINLPKPELAEALTLMDRDGSYWESAEGKSVWLSLHRRIHLKFATSSTTERLAQYVLEVQQREAAKIAA